MDLHRYLCAIANRELPRCLRARLDPDDLVQQTYLDAARVGGDRPPAWYAEVLRNNIRNAVRDHTAEKRDVNRERNGTVEQPTREEQRPKPSRPPRKCTPAAFVTAWQSSRTLAEVAEKTGLTVKAARHRAGDYRRRGINLKKFHRPAQMDVAALNKLATESLRDD